MDPLVENNQEFIGKYGSRVYYYKDGELTSRAYFIPIQPGTAAQQARWAIWRAGVEAWQSLTTDQQEVWNKDAYWRKITGFNLWMSKWNKGEVDMLDKILIDTYTGDGTNNRIIDLGDIYDEVHIYNNEPVDKEEAGCLRAWAVQQSYGLIYEDIDDKVAAGETDGAADNFFQGKLFSPGDENKIKLGSNGTNKRGTNYSGWVYRIVAKKYRAIATLP